MTATDSSQILKHACIAPEIFQLRPDYRALLLLIDGIRRASSDTASETFFLEAETHVRDLFTQHSMPELPHITAWRGAYKSFGANPNKKKKKKKKRKKERKSLEALSQRITKAGGGLPRVNRLTDIYNAVSVKHQIPLGGDDLDKYEGAPFLVRANWSEPFQAFSGVGPQIEYAAPGEPIWCDGAGITCRRWNWRQGPRTRMKW